MTTVPYEATKANYTGFVPGRTWLFIALFGAVAAGTGAYLAEALNTDEGKVFCDTVTGCLDAR